MFGYSTSKTSRRYNKHRRNWPIKNGVCEILTFERVSWHPIERVMSIWQTVMQTMRIRLSLMQAWKKPLSSFPMSHMFKITNDLGLFFKIGTLKHLLAKILIRGYRHAAQKTTKNKAAIARTMLKQESSPLFGTRESIC